MDSLGLGLTLDTTLLEKADKTLENMQRNSQLIMQNLNKGFSAFNRGDISDFSKPFDAIKKAMDTIKNSKVSIEFESEGQDRFLDGLNQIMEQVERIRQIGEIGGDKVRFFDPSEVRVTTESLTELKAKAEEIGEAFKKVQEELSLGVEFGKDISGNNSKIDKLKDDLSEIGKAAELTTKEFTQMENELKNVADISEKEYKDIKKIYEERFNAIKNEELSKNSNIGEEELANIVTQKEEIKSLIDSVIEKQAAWNEAKKSLEEYSKKFKELRELEAKKEAHDNLQLNRDKEKAYQEMLADNMAEQKFAGATIAQQNAMLVSQEQKRLADTNKEVANLTKLYKEATSNLEKYKEELSELLTNIGTVGKKRTTAQDEEVTRLLKEINQARSILHQLRTEAPEVIEKIEAAKTGEGVQKKAAEDAAKVKASLDYAKVFSDNAKSIDEEIEAISMLKRARNALASDTTADYNKEIAEANKRISKHEDHIKLLTQEQKESKTLEDSVISRYLRERKEADKLGDELRELNRTRKERGTDYTPEEKENINALISRWRTLRKDISEIEENNEAHLSQLQEKYASQRAEEEIKRMLSTNEREKQEYAKLLDEKYALEKQKKSMEDAGAKKGDKAYDNILKQEQDLNNRISQLRAKHKKDLEEIDKKHNKKVNDDAVKSFITAEKEKQKEALESLKKRVANEKKYGTISGATAERLISFTDTAKNAAQHKKAIDSLQKARERLNATDKDYLKTVKRLNEAIKYHEIEIELTDEKSKNLMQTHRGLMDIGGQLMRRLALVFSVSQLTQYFRKLVEVRGEFEKTEVALTTILKSRAQANVLMNQITDLAVKSPFTLQQLVGYTKQLAAYQIEYKKLYSTTKMLADVSAGLGVEMDRLILAFGQVRAANFLRATEVRQFTEAGFDILGELAKYYSDLKGKMVSVGEVQEMVTKRMVGFADVEKVFQKVTSAGGIFYDMQAKQAETLAGQWSNLQDKISIMYNEIGKSTDGMLKGIVGFLASLIDNWEGAATVLKSLIATFAVVKINSMLASNEMIKFARTMNVIKGKRKAITIIELFQAGFIKLGRSIKAAGTALKAFIISNPEIAALIALAGVIGTVVSKHHKQAEAVKEVSKRYDELHESITNVNAAMLNAINEKDIEKQKDALKELVEMVDKEYNMKVNIDIESLTPEEIAAKFNEIREEVEKLNIFGAVFGSGLEGFKASGMLTNDLLKDISQYGEAANELFKQMVDKSAMVASSLQEIDAEKYKDIIKDLVTPRDIMGGESELTYLNRLYEAYSKIKEESSIDLTWDEDTDQYIARTSENFYALGKILGEIDFKSLSTDYANALKEFKDVEFINYLDTLENSLKGLTDEQKEKKLKFAIDTEAAHREWNAFVVQLMYEIANTKFGLSIKPEVEAPDVTKWEKWQENYKKEFEKEEGYMPITSPSITQEAQIKALNEEYKKQYDLLERIKNAGGESALEVGGAYEGLGKTMGEITAEMEDLNAQIEYLGGTNTTIDKNEKASQKILNRRISILKEIHEAYNQARKDDLGHEEAIQKVMKDWGDTFREAFEGTSINLSSLVVDKDKLNELKNSATEAGTVFSENMEAAMQEVFDNNTYIRESNEAAEKFTKSWEQAILKAKDVEGKGEAYTIGYGEYDVYKDTGKKINKDDTITQGEAEERFTKVVYPKYVAALNKILDVNKDLIFTQDQYNALLDVTYQGGKGATEKLLLRARDEEKGIAYIESIRKKIAETFGDEKASRFGEEFVQKFKEAENIYERIALLMEATNLTIGNQIDKVRYQGMQSRSDARAAMFSGDTIISNLLQQASQTIADFDFATPEGLVKALRGLVPIAKKEGKEAMLALSKEISKVENEFGVKIRLENVKQFEDDIDKALLNYKSWKDLKKLSVPNDIAASLFGVTPQSLEQVRKKVLEALNLGKEINLGNEQDVLAAVKLQYGEPTEKVVRDFLKNVSKMENDEQEERLKKYVEYAKKGLSERAKIKLEELKKLQEIEETFKVKEGDSADVKAQKEDMSKRASEKVRKESQDAMNKLDWEEFEKSDTFINIFDDIDNASTTLLNHMIGRLEEFKEQWKDMPLEDVNKIIEKLNLLQEKLAKAKPSEAAKKARDEIKAARGQIEMEGVEKIEFKDKEAKELAKKRGKGGFFAALDEEQAYQDQQKEAAQEQISLLETALRIKEGTATASDKVLQEESKIKDMLNLSKDELEDQLKAQQGIVSNADKQNGKIQKARQSQKNLTAAQEAQREAIQDSVDMANDLYGAFKDLIDVLDADDPAMVFADMGMNILSSIPTMLTLISQIHAATIAAEGLGAAMNMAMGVVGLIVMAIQLLVQAISAAVNYAEKMRQMKLDVLAGQVDNLKKKYDALAESIEKAWSYKQLEEYSKELDKVQKKMISAQKQYVQLLRSGKGAEDIIARAEQAQRKLDAGQSVDSLSNKERKALLSEEYQDYKDATEALAEMEEDYVDQKKELLDELGGVTDPKEAAEEFVDAWLDAYKETGDGLSGLDEKFDEFFENLIKKKAAMIVAEKALTGWIDAVNNALDMDSGGGADITDEEQKAINKAAEEAKEKANRLLLGIFEGMDFSEADGLSGLQKGIQGITEQQAEVLTAYWNSVRGYTASIDSKMDLILANMGAGSENNPMLEQLISQTSYLKYIKEQLSYVLSPSGTTALKVRLLE